MMRDDFAEEEPAGPKRAVRRKFSVRSKPPAPRRRVGPEALLQIQIVKWMRRAFFPPPEGPYWSAINPVPHKSFTVAQRSKAMGMRAGIADLLLVWKGRAIAPELKDKKGGLSASQLVFRREFTLAGGLTFEVKSLEEFKLMIEVIGIPTRGAA